MAQGLHESHDFGKAIKRSDESQKDMEGRFGGRQENSDVPRPRESGSKAPIDFLPSLGLSSNWHRTTHCTHELIHRETIAKTVIVVQSASDAETRLTIKRKTETAYRGIGSFDLR